MKKFLALSLALVMIFAVAACGGSSDPAPAAPAAPAPAPEAPAAEAPAAEAPPAEAPPPADEGFPLALITDLGTIDDKGFNQGSWEGLVQYAEENGIAHKYYKPADQGDDAYLNAIDLAVQEGAKVIVTPGFLFETPIFHAQDRYPDTKFVLLDGAPNDGDWSTGAPTEKVGDNTIGITYAEEQAGFLVGYAAVMDGYRNLGFLGGMAVPAVVRFGHGFVQGAEYAAEELGLDAGSINMNYFYTGTFAPEPDIQTRAAAWYNEGVEVIFSCGGGILFSIFPSAEQTGKWVIGVDTDQSGESPTIITSAMKLLSQSVYDMLSDYYAGTFKGGQKLHYNAANNGVGIPFASSKFNTFTEAQYEAIYAKLVDGSIKVDDDSSINADQLPTSAVKVNFFN